MPQKTREQLKSLWVTGATMSETMFDDLFDSIFIKSSDPGSSGPQGPTGIQGPIGVTGEGYQGYQGPQGTIGPRGYQGDQGNIGPQGHQGSTGVQGSTGPQGYQGDLGNQGLTGPQGVQGNQGPRGYQGYQGDIGPTGIEGPQGNQGPRGYQGYQGDIGPTGIEGPQGNQGVQGPKGFQGDQGITGPKGFQGDQGITGPQGNQGITGPQGPKGATSGILGPTGPQGVQGTQGITGPQGFQGDQGPQGPNGQTGNTGPQGFQGYQGPQGPRGYQGYQGNTGPQGDQGPQGPRGYQGYQGNAGQTGNTGPQGTQGHQGPIGSTGAQGHQGPTGPQGSQGAYGPTGTIVFENIYLTYSGSTGTLSGTNGVTLTSPGHWTVTHFDAVYFLDDSAGNLEITIPDADLTNEGKTLVAVKPRIVTSANVISIKTVSNQKIAQSSLFYLTTPDDRVEFVSCNFGSNGYPERKYRITIGTQNSPQTFRVSQYGSLFSDIKSAIDYINTYVSGPAHLIIEAGTYTISSKITISKSDFSIEGRGPGSTIITVNPAINTNAFEIASSGSIRALTVIGSTGSCFRFSGNNAYYEFHTLELHNFKKAVSYGGTGNQIWFFDSIVQDCSEAAFDIANGGLEMSECTINNCGTSIIVNGGTDIRFAVQNTQFLVNAGQTGINWISQNSRKYAIVTGNSFYGSGTYLNGFHWGATAYSDIRIESNSGIESYRPSYWQQVSGNASSTSLTNQNQYYPAVVNAAKVINHEYIKYLGSTANTSAKYLPSISRKQTFIVSGTISGSANNDILSVAIYKNGTTLIGSIEVRVQTAGIAYPFSFNCQTIVNRYDTYDIRIANTSSAGKTSVLKSLMYNIFTT